MNSLRIARAALRARPAAIRVPLQRRTYAEAVPDKARTFSATVFMIGSTNHPTDQAELGSPSPGMTPPERSIEITPDTMELIHSDAQCGPIGG